jgi:hypothetical protein
MIEFQPWMYPVLVLVMVLVTSRILFWRLDVSEKRWLREQARKAQGTPAE